MSPEEQARLLALDRAHVWHPFSQMQSFEADPPTVLSGAEGVWLHTGDGRRLLDGIASWWVNLLGHRHPDLDRAIQSQLGDMAHVMFARFTHAPAVTLAESLVKLAPPGLDHVFYSDNGSTAVEVALKMAFQYWQNLGETRPLFICLEQGYHGDTLGAISVGGVPKWHDRWAPLLYSALKAPSPSSTAPGALYPSDPQAAADASLKAVEAHLLAHPGEIAGVIIEPLCQGAAGMHFHPPSYLRGLRRLCDDAGVFLIFDEVATGIFRTGEAFASKHANVTPDLMALSKAITGGYLPLGATLCTEAIFQGFYGDDAATFDHGHSYTGNPLATAVGAAALKIVSDLDWQAATAEKAAHFQGSWSKVMTGRPGVRQVRGLGFIGALTLGDLPEGWSGEGAALEICKRAFDAGLFIRPLGDVLYFLPPLAITPGEIDWAMETLGEAIDSFFAP